MLVYSKVTGSHHLKRRQRHWNKYQCDEMTLAICIRNCKKYPKLIRLWEELFEVKKEDRYSGEDVEFWVDIHPWFLRGIPEL